ncbi:unnamed protein product [Gongylonema pulchrum]|uniref:Uncharacterized protein n=1 Tax=Gongylonema pulchrum TaxID=637853 RepID=A0A183EEY0_9BILA|nr:unnamed protein product [Gongylonema pulchrum]
MARERFWQKIIRGGLLVKEEPPTESEQPMFDPEQGSDNEMLERKCESIGMEVPDGPYSVLGIFDIAAVKRNDAESDYWGDPRFLCNRRNAFNWKRDKSSKHTLGPNARRFVKQLLFGKLDVPASRLDSSYYQPKMYTRIVLSNLRKLCLEKKKAVNAEEVGTLLQ